MVALYSRMAWIAPRKVGLSHSTTSPGSTSTFNSRSKAWLPPCTGRICVESQFTPSPLRNSATLSRKGPKPSVAPYCSSVVPYLSSASTASREMTSGSSDVLEGLPPAKEIMPGRASSLKMSRMALPVMGRMCFANISSVNCIIFFAS